MTPEELFQLMRLADMGKVNIYIRDLYDKTHSSEFTLQERVHFGREYQAILSLFQQCKR